MASLFASVWLVGRVKYSEGYYTGKPEARVPGAKMTFLGAQLPLLLLSISSTAGFLGWW